MALLMRILDEAKFPTIVAGIATISIIATLGIIGGIGQQQVASARPVCVNAQLPGPAAGTFCTDRLNIPVCPDGLIIISPKGELKITCP